MPKYGFKVCGGGARYVMCGAKDYMLYGVKDYICGAKDYMSKSTLVPLWSKSLDFDQAEPKGLWTSN